MTQYWGLPAAWVLLRSHLTSRLFSTSLLCSYKGRTTALSARVPVLSTLLGPIYLMVFIRAVLMPQNCIALPNFAVVGETIIKVV